MNGLAELHVHLYGCIRPRDLLDHLQHVDADLGWYEDAYEDAYGHRPDAQAVIDRHRRGDPSAEQEFERLFVFGDEDAGNFARFQAKFNLLSASSAIRRDDVDALGAELDHFLARIRAGHARAGTTYVEHRVRLGPTLRTPLEVSFYDHLLDHCDTATGITERVAVSLWREDPWPGWERTQELLLGPHGHVVTGVDFCHVEEGHPPKDKAEFFAEVHRFNDEHPDRAVAILYHVGESFQDKSLESAVRWVREAAELGAHRLGHAIALGVDPDALGPHQRTERREERIDQLRDDLAHADELASYGVVVDREGHAAELRRLEAPGAPDTVTHTYDVDRLHEVRARQEHAMARVARTGAVIEVCPTSNRRIGAIDDIEHHPVHRFVDAGLPVVVSSDDPGIFGVDLTHEVDWVATHAEVDRDELVAAAWRHRSERMSGRE